jgi:hypothetical protein
MADDDEKRSALEDLRKGLGLLFRAAKTTIEKIPTGELEEAVLTGAKEVGRAIENVAQTVEQQVFRKPTAKSPSEKASSENASSEKSGPSAGARPPERSDSAERGDGGPPKNST